MLKNSLWSGLRASYISASPSALKPRCRAFTAACRFTSAGWRKNRIASARTASITVSLTPCPLR